MTRFFKFWPMGLLLALSGCGLPPIVSAVSYAVEGVSYAASGKSVTDHALSAAADSDCAMFRVVKGEEICREDEATPPEGTALAMIGTTEPANTLDPADNTPSGTPVLYSFGTADATPANGWQIADEAGLSANTGNDAEAPQDVLIAPERVIPVRESAPAGKGSDQVLSIRPGIELFALVQENGTLELFAYDDAQTQEQDKLILVASIDGYADDPSVFSGISRNDRFIAIEDLIV